MSGEGDRPALLVLACSRRKSLHIRRGRAWDLYDGRVFQVLKKALRDRAGWESAIEILIVSARHGVVGFQEVIETYDERLTAARASEIARGSMPRLRRLLKGRTFRAAHANLGRDYRSAVPELAGLLAPTPIDWASGPIGARNARTRDWVLGRLAEADVGITCGRAPRRLPRR